MKNRLIFIVILLGLTITISRVIAENRNVATITPETPRPEKILQHVQNETIDINVEKTICPICLEGEINDSGDAIPFMPAEKCSKYLPNCKTGHANFHEECLKTSLIRTNRQCPLCRASAEEVQSTIFETNIWQVIATGNTSCLQNFMQMYPRINFLHLAVLFGSIPTIKFILDCGTPINTQDRDGETALHYAALIDDDEKIRFLLSIPAIDTSIRSTDGQTAADISQTPKIKNLILAY